MKRNFNYEVRCFNCKEMHVINIDSFDFIDWENGKLAQDVFTYLTPAERELITSGICNECWKDMFDLEEDAEGEEYRNTEPCNEVNCSYCAGEVPEDDEYYVDPLVGFVHTKCNKTVDECTCNK